MSGTIQLIVHAILVGITIGLGLAAFKDRQLINLVIASFFWICFWLHLANSTWIPTWGQGQDRIDRLGILIRGSGFVAWSFAAIVPSAAGAFFLGLFGLILIVLGRAAWELIEFSWNRVL
jgi:hypothetical protein